MPASTLTATTVMPGSFTFDSTLPPKLDVNVGARSHIYQPPKTPSASGSLHLSRVSLSTHDGRPSTTSKRKRSQRDSSSPAPDPAMSMNSDAWSRMTCESPEPLAYSQYKLAGGMDTPTAEKAYIEELYPSVTMPAQSGRLLRPLDMSEAEAEDHMAQVHASSALARERNGRARVPTSPGVTDGLGRAVYSFAGVAGKVWDFCRTTAFHGFFAGGGQGFEMRHSSYPLKEGEQSLWQEIHEEKDSGFNWQNSDDSENGILSTPIPGRFPEEDFIPDYMSQDHSSPSPQRPAKRRQRERDSGDGTTGLGDEMSTSWMVVSRSTSPTRDHNRSSRNSPARALKPTHSSASHASNTPTNFLRRHPSRQVLPASYARSSPSRSQRHRTSLQYPPPLTSGNGSQPIASFASPRSPTTQTPTPKSHSERPSLSSTTSTNNKNASPLNDEVQRHAARIRRREVEEEANLQRFNAQLKAMIREGKEALGTRVEVGVWEDG